jgi:hypothetical protein
MTDCPPVERVLITVVLVGLALAVAAVLRRQTSSRAPVRAGYSVPTALDRNGFVRPDAPWLVVSFSSETCAACRGAWEKVRQLESELVAVEDVDSVTGRDRHRRYRVEAVPLVLVADQDGVVRASFIGEPTAADLWAAVADLRFRR